MKREDWTVTESATRPVGNPDECFYCQRKLGEQHQENCVIRKKTVVVDFTIRMVVDAPEYWNEKDVEFRYNEGTWCADNLIEMMTRDKELGCLCSHVEAKYVREATETDEENWGSVKVDELKS